MHLRDRKTIEQSEQEEEWEELEMKSFSPADHVKI
jgi:hypothetical protein